jgi:hypothetical protein
LITELINFAKSFNEEEEEEKENVLEKLRKILMN